MKKRLGSTDFVGISRNQFGLARRADGVRGFIVFHMKTNFENGDSMLFTMSDANGREGGQPKISFDTFTKITADEFFSGEASSRGPEQDEREVAKKYLLEVLAGGPKAATILKSQGEARAISASTLTGRGRNSALSRPRRVKSGSGRSRPLDPTFQVFKFSALGRGVRSYHAISRRPGTFHDVPGGENLKT